MCLVLEGDIMEYYARFDDATIQQLVDAMQTGLNTEEITITQNGTYVAPVGKGFTPVVVNVEQGGTGLQPYHVTVKLYEFNIATNEYEIDDGAESVRVYANTNSQDITMEVPLTNGVGEITIYGGTIAYIEGWGSYFVLCNEELAQYTGVDRSDAKYDANVACPYVDSDNGVIAVINDAATPM